jgi:hypothetical protein
LPLTSWRRSERIIEECEVEKEVNECGDGDGGGQLKERRDGYGDEVGLDSFSRECQG